MARQRFTAVWAALAVGLAALSSLVIGLAVNAVPKSWGWAHSWWLLSGIGACLLVIAVLVAVFQVHSSPDSGDKTDPVMHVAKPHGSSVTGSNTGTLISVETVIIGAAGTTDLGNNSQSPPNRNLDASTGESPRAAPFPQQETASAPSKRKGIAKDAAQVQESLVLRATKITRHGESINIEIFNTATAKQWIINDPWGHSDAFGAEDDE